ncbi:MAG: phosphoribosylformylglycinamidine synthase subunit PurL [Planctomycetaceae bacterium]|nr:phosphoribosylformylglycinamidine synthase subunit PurL [Planctomycetaceae bacterium]
MLWEICVFPAENQPDVHGKAVLQDARDLGIAGLKSVRSSYGYLIQGDAAEEEITKYAAKLLADPVVQRFEISSITGETDSGNATVLYVLPKPGVTDSVAENVEKLLLTLHGKQYKVRTFKKYFLSGIPDEERKLLAAKLLANDAIEQTVNGLLPFTSLDVGAEYKFNLVTVPLLDMSNDDLTTLSKEGQLYLSLTEMQVIQKAFRDLGRNPTDIELETLAQTWSEHCSHKTLAGRIHYIKKDADGRVVFERNFKNMLKETIFATTQELRKTDRNVADLCVSVFSDNAGVVRFDDDFNVCFKVETHNHPSALEPYGGANTGLGGVIRDPMGTGLGAKPIASTDVFCFAPPDTPQEKLPDGVLHPKRIMKGVVAGVRDYGNRMGIPTVNGAVYFDERYLGNPLVFCGNIGIMPKDKSFKEPKAGDYIVALGGRTGRDGIHGATFSSAELTHESETLSGGAVQIGNAITEKMVLDVMLQARDRNLYNAITDCGAGGFSSAVGEMGEKIGAEVELSNAPLKYEGLSYTEIWISEAQERMVFSVPPEKWDEFRQLCESEDVEAVVLGTFKPTERLVLKYHGETVCDLSMDLLHNGRPPVVREAVYSPPNNVSVRTDEGTLREVLKSKLSSLNIASKHWIIRQYDHEVQAGSVIKPLVGVQNDGPGDAAVLRPRLDSRRGLVVSCGLNPVLGDVDTYQMAVSAIDEAVRNAVAVGADPKTIVLLDNFCWGNCENPETLGSLVEAALACYDVSIAFRMPFVSGKDSLNNEFRLKSGADSGTTIAIPPTLLISATGQIDDVAKCITMDVKAPGNILYEVSPRNCSDLKDTLKFYNTVHKAIQGGILRSVHDVSDGGLAIAVAEMCFAGGFGADLTCGNSGAAEDFLFAESNSRFVMEVEPNDIAAVESLFASFRLLKLGTVSDNKTLVFKSFAIEADIDELKAVWQSPLDWC